METYNTDGDDELYMDASFAIDGSLDAETYSDGAASSSSAGPDDAAAAGGCTRECALFESDVDHHIYHLLGEGRAVLDYPLPLAAVRAEAHSLFPGNFMLDAGWLAHAFMLYSSLFFVVFKCFGAQIITGDSEDYLMDEVSRSSDAPDAQAWGAAEAGASPRRGTMQISTQVATAQPLAVVPPNRHAHQARKPPPI